MINSAVPHVQKIGSVADALTNAYDEEMNDNGIESAEDDLTSSGIGISLHIISLR
jgi:hypothetical protein